MPKLSTARNSLASILERFPGGTMRSVICLARALTGVALFVWCAAAGALSISLQPLSSTFQQGTPFSLSVVVSGLSGDSEILSAYDFDIGFDPSLVHFSGAASAGGLGAGSLFLASDPGSVTNSINLFELAVLSDADLSALQGDPLTVATLTFVGIASGTAQFSFGEFHALGGFTPPGGSTDDLLPLLQGTTGAQVIITDRTSSVPEPSSLLLFGLGALLLTTPRLRRRAR
jgi:hypothetical protein